MSQSLLRGFILATVIVTGAAAAGCFSAGTSDPATPKPPARDASPPAAGAAEVIIQNVKYSPAELTVAVGTTVTWTNRDDMGHSVTPVDPDEWGTTGSGDAPSEWLGKDESWSFTFTKPGRYEYRCIPHSFGGGDGEYGGQTGVVIVTEEGAAGGDEPATERTVVPDPVAPARTLPDEDGVVRLSLTTKEVEAQVADGTAYTFWTFDGTVPGPMLRVREGDTVELTVRNDVASTLHHSIDLHAVTGPGGGAVATQTAPGESTAFRFKALNPGVYVYHCATAHVPTHVANGMYGLIVVEPEKGLPPVDREFYVVQGELYTTGKVGEKGAQGFDFGKMMDENAEYFLMNGRVGALTGDGALRARTGETVRVYFGVGGFVPSSFHVIGEIFDRVYPEGGTPAVNDVQTTLVPAGGASVVEFRVDVPGTYVLVDHTLTRAIDRGAAGHLVVEGDEDPAVFHGDTTGSGH